MAPSKKAPPQNTDNTPEKNLGAILREARERLGLDYARLSEITRLQPHILESLEKEEWHTFSAPVFIKGFLRSYAKALGLDVGAILAMYDEKNPGVDSPPRPLSSISTSHRRTPAFFILLVLLAAAVFLALHYASRRETREQLPAVESSNAPIMPAPEQHEIHAKGNAVGGVHATKPETAPEPTEKQPTKENETNTQEKPALPETVQKEAPAPAPETPAPPRQEIAKPEEKSPEPVKTKPTPPAKPLTLKADVRETTWVKIILDQGEPKEYIFQPGSRPEWRAQHGFELFIGNAAGISLEFNGKKMDNLGGHGKVIHLKLPQKTERNTSE